MNTTSTQTGPVQWDAEGCILFCQQSEAFYRWTDADGIPHAPQNFGETMVTGGHYANETDWN